MNSGDDVLHELQRLREDNEDLRASALLWKKLYEAALTRARELDRRSHVRRAELKVRQHRAG
jgi:hypothetical protein